MNAQKVAVIGASGYSGEELVRILLRHPHAQLAAVSSRQHAGKRLDAVFPRFGGYPGASLPFVDSTVEAIVGSGAGVVLLALPHGVAAEFASPLVAAGLRVIDLSADFRIKDPAVYEAFYGEPPHAPELAQLSVYGLPEVYRDQIRGAQLVASPGCYPTSILLPLIPLLRRRLIVPGNIDIASMSGVSGAGRNAKLDYLYAECNESVRAYGAPNHRHLAEIEQELSIAWGATVRVNFTPHLIPVTRGIHTTIYAQPAAGVGEAQVAEALRDAYAHEPFVRLIGSSGFVDTKHVTGTNFCDIAWRMDPRTGRLLLFSAEDNLIKGAAGQAVQSLNLLCGWPETDGLL